MEISIDLETFSSAPDASIATIGVAARRHPDHCVNGLYLVVDDPDGRFTPDTIRWHASQEDPASTTGASAGRGKEMPLEDALRALSKFLTSLNADTEGEARIWTHATFDMPVLESAFVRAGISWRPWHYRNCRDLRTLYDLSGGRPELDRVGTHHNALDDAVYQLYEVEACFRQMDPEAGGSDGEG